ncbi:TPA: acetyl-CoA carboxylase carboxyl transferase subunit alpha, partial [Bacillus cereus]
MSLDFERPIIELKEKFDELKKIMKENNVDLSPEIHVLEKRLNKMQDKIHSNITPFQRVQIARLRNRLTTLDYIPLLFTNFLE